MLTNGTHMSLILHMMLSEWDNDLFCKVATAAEAETHLNIFFPVHNLQGQILNQIDLYKGKARKDFGGH